MDSIMLIGTWTGTAANSNGFDLEIGLTITEPPQVGAAFATFNIPAIPCSGQFKLLSIQGNTYNLKAESLEGPCGDADSDSLELQADGTLLYISKGQGWETKGILRLPS